MRDRDNPGRGSGRRTSNRDPPNPATDPSTAASNMVRPTRAATPKQTTLPAQFRSMSPRQSTGHNHKSIATEGQRPRSPTAPKDHSDHFVNTSRRSSPTTDQSPSFQSPGHSPARATMEAEPPQVPKSPAWGLCYAIQHRRVGKPHAGLTNR